MNRIENLPDLEPHYKRVYESWIKDHPSVNDRELQHFFIEGHKCGYFKPEKIKRKVVQMIEHMTTLFAVCDDGVMYRWKVQYENDEWKERWIEMPRPIPQD
jgi:hypothetical protein